MIIKCHVLLYEVLIDWFNDGVQFEQFIKDDIMVPRDYSWFSYYVAVATVTKIVKGFLWISVVNYKTYKKCLRQSEHNGNSIVNYAIIVKIMIRFKTT